VIEKPVASARPSAMRAYGPFLAIAILIALIFSAFQALDLRDTIPSNDTYQYARQTLRLLGDSQQVAVQDSVSMFCHEIGNSPALAGELQAEAAQETGKNLDRYSACVYVYRDGLTPSSPRYIAIFTSRPGYPLLAVPFVAVFGLTSGMWITTMLCMVAASLLVLALLRVVGCSRAVALAGQALFLAAPTGYWSSRMLTDGPSLAADLLCLLGAWWLTQQQIRRGAWVFIAGVIAGFVFRYSTATMLTLEITLAALVCLWLIRGSRHRGMYWLAGLAGGATIVTQLLSTLLGWPGFSDSLQDTFTNHFERPDVADPLNLLLHANLSLWRAFPNSSSDALLLPAGMLIVAVFLWRRDRVFTVLTVAVALTGIASVVAHPIASQDDRLIMPSWLLIVLGLPLLAARRAAQPALPPSDPPPDGDSRGDQTAAHTAPEPERTAR
jgi:hypothetical protein